MFSNLPLCHLADFGLVGSWIGVFYRINGFFQFSSHETMISCVIGVMRKERRRFKLLSVTRLMMSSKSLMRCPFVPLVLIKA